MFTEVVTVLSFILIVVILIRLLILERRINRLYKARQEEIDKLEKEPMLKSTWQAILKQIDRKYQPRIDQLERKRRFILDRLPFIKK